MRQRRVVILGATGSIGQSALKVARDISERMEIVGLSAHSNAAKLQAAAQDFPNAKLAISSGPDGVERLIELATLPEADLVLIAIVGTGGLRPALAAIEAGKDIAVASKEILVMAGEAVMTAARRKGVNVLPVDSEHNAIFQCLDRRSALPRTEPRRDALPCVPILPGVDAAPESGTGRSPSLRNDIRRLILTASGGPFRKWPAASLAGVTPEQALKHPTWTMGAKITVDSATLFNKGLEMIEARWLFDVEMARVEVIVHPQSIVHSMVEFIDSSILAQLSTTDMCFPIQYAVTYPDRVPNSLPPLDFAKLAKLEFEAPRIADFPALSLARTAGEIGGTLPAVLNAANEVAVAAFLQRRCSFPAIWETVAAVMGKHQSIAGADLDAILSADSWARTWAGELLGV